MPRCRRLAAVPLRDGDDVIDRPHALIAARVPARNASRVPAMLREAGCRITALAPVASSLAHSWLVDRHVPMPIDPSAAVAELRRVVAAEPFAFIVIADEGLLLALGDRLAPWMSGVLPFPTDPTTTALIFDKNRLLVAMRAAGIDIPPFEILSPGGDVLRAATRVGFPLVLKDAVGCAGAGVRRVDSAEELVPALASLQPAGDFTVQRFLQSRSGCTDVVFDRGVPRIWTSAYMQDQWPRPMDPASVRKPVRLPGAERMLRALGELTRYHGLGGIDWIETADGNVFFLEFNARVTHVVGPARPAFGREIGAMLRGEPANPHELVLGPDPVPIFPVHFIRALKERRSDLPLWLPLRKSSVDLDWRDGGVLATELGDLVRGALKKTTGT